MPVELKFGKLTHQDLVLMRRYVNLFDHSDLAKGKAPTIDIVLPQATRTTRW